MNVKQVTSIQEAIDITREETIKLAVALLEPMKMPARPEYEELNTINKAYNEALDDVKEQLLNL